MNSIFGRWYRSKRLWSCMLALACTGCAHRTAVDTTRLPDFPEKSELQNLTHTADGAAESAVVGLRATALRELALSLGARSGLAHRMQRIHRDLEDQAAALDAIFRFESLLLDNRVLPPVLIEARDTLQWADEHRIRISNRQYALIKQARFVTAAPTWRDYLLIAYPKPERPDNTLLPQNAAEVRLWKQAIAQGWDQGVVQADAIYAENLAALKRDYEGMIRYRMLLAQKMVSAPHVARRNLGVTGGGESLAIGDETLEITALPSLQPDALQWQAQVAVQPELVQPVSDEEPCA